VYAVTKSLLCVCVWCVTMNDYMCLYICGCKLREYVLGTAIVIGKKGHRVWTDGKDPEWLSRGVYNTYTAQNLRYSQVS